MLSVILTTILPPGETSTVRFIYGMAAIMRLLRSVEMLWSPSFFESRSMSFAIKFAFLYHDLRKATKATSDALTHALSHLIKVFAWFVSSVLALRALPVSAPPIAKICLGAIRSWAALAFVEACYATHLAAFGIQSPLCFDHPLQSQTVAEFWNTRWNLAIARQLSNVAYKPLAEMGYKTTGVWATFVASAILHICPFLFLGGSKKAIQSTLLFFFTQPILMLVENKFKLKGPVWVASSFFTTAPLFVGYALSYSPCF